MFITECQLFVKRKKIFLLCLLFAVGMILWGIRISAIEEYEVIRSLEMTIELAKYSFPFFLITAYLYTVEDCRDGIAEVIAAIASGRLKASLYKILVLQIWNGIITAFFLGINIYLSIYGGGRGGKEYIQYVVELWILYFTLPNLLASLLGLCLSGVQNKRMGYSGIVLFSYMFAGGFAFFLQMMSQKIDVLYRIADIFCIFARGTRRAVNAYYLIPIEGNNWLRIMIWIILAEIILLNLLGTRKRKFKTIVFFIVLAGIFSLYIRPFGGAYNDGLATGHDEWTTDQYYYAIYQYEGEIEPARFRVTDYDIRFTVDRELSADVIMKLDITDLEQYAFTLYHGYRIKSVQDKDGNDLSYVRERDYIRIVNDTEYLDEIHIRYAGYSRFFYATSQGIYLPAYFDYYPTAGCKKIFDNEAYEYVRKDVNATSHFRLTIDAPETVFTSLEQTDEGSYEGDAEGVTILGSRFAKCFWGDGIRIVYSGLAHDEQDIEAYYEQMLEWGVPNELKVVFLEGFTMYEHFYSDTSQLLAYDFMLEEDFGKYLENLKEGQGYD